MRSDVDEATAFDGPDIEDRIAAFANRTVPVPPEAEEPGLLLRLLRSVRSLLR